METADLDRARKRLENSNDAAKQRGLAGAVRTDHREQRPSGDLAIEVMHRRMPVIAQRDIAESDLRGHAHRIEIHTMAHSAALTASAANSRETTVMRRIDQGAACAGCAEARP